MQQKYFGSFLFLILFSTEDAFANRFSSFSENQWRYAIESSNFESANTAGYTSRSHLDGIRVGYAFENEGWSFFVDGTVGNLNGVERVMDSPTVRNLKIQDILWAINIAPRFHLNLGRSSRIYIGMGGTAELHFTKLPTNITYNRLLKKDLQFGFGPIYLFGFDFLVGDSSRVFIEYIYRNVEVPQFEINNYKVIGPMTVLGFTW